MKKLVLLAAAILFGNFAQKGLAHDYSVGELKIIHPVVFETSPTAKAGAGYMKIANNGESNDRLLEVRAEFPRVMIHNTETTDGVARMMHVEALDIPAGETVELSPGGLHVMLMGLSEPLENGVTVPATLVFEKAGEVEIVFQVVERPEHGGIDHSNH